MEVSKYIKKSLNDQYYDKNVTFLREYYTLLLNKADEHKRIVQTNKDVGFITIDKKIING